MNINLHKMKIYDIIIIENKERKELNNMTYIIIGIIIIVVLVAVLVASEIYEKKRDERIEKEIDRVSKGDRGFFE